MAPLPPASRVLLGKVLLASAAMMWAAAAAFWFGVIAVDDPVRTMATAVLFLAGLADGFVSLRFLGES